ncbi:MAG: DNA-directed RNA polymerase subunit omega [Thermoanaerobaculia bacterium]
MENLPSGIDSKFRLVLLAAERAEQLVRGAAARTAVRHEKAARTALGEIDSGLIEWGYGPAPQPEAETEEPATDEA